MVDKDNSLSFEAVVNYIVRYYGGKSAPERMACCQRFQQELGYDSKKLFDAVNDKIR